jgi:hypothetical protein
MPVIGRLDKQVEDVIISPVSKRRGEDQTPQESDPDTHATSEQTPPPTQTPTENESSTKADELPVWLL